MARPRELDAPFVGADRELPEITLKGMALGIVLAVLLGAANMYVGLRVGMTVSASIPAAVISMGLLRLMRNSNILENNVVQTVASAGETLAAGIIFTVPALLLLDAGGVVSGAEGFSTPIWPTVRVPETLMIAIAGGLLGVLLCIPLRRAYIVESRLPFPEGVACGEVLKTGEQGGAGVKVLAGGILVGAGYAFLQGGLRLWEEALEGARRVGDGMAYLGTNLTPILLGVGFIVGLRVASYIALGGALAWFVLIPLMMTVGIPFVTAPTPYPELAPLDAAYTVWNSKIRLVGGGAMITGGLFTLWKTRASLGAAFRTRRGGADGGGPADRVPRTERDIPLKTLGIATLALTVPIAGLFYYFTGDLVQTIAATALMGVAGFFFSAVAGYMAGTVGSSNNPISGVTIVTLITSSLLLVALGAAGGAGITAALGIGAVICCAAAMAGDTLQDLKSGAIVGATPWKQQLAQVVGVVAFGLTAPFVLMALVTAYGIGGAGLPAPQAFLMSSILGGIFGNTLDWSLVVFGGLVGAALAAARVPVMAVAVGIYLPFPLSAPIFAGGALAWAVERAARRARTRDVTGASGVRVTAIAETTEAQEARVERVKHTGLLFASGLIAGEALMGVLIAGFILLNTDNPLLVTGRMAPLVLGLLAAAAALVFVPGKQRKLALAGALGGLGLLGTLGLAATGYEYHFEPGAQWPGLLVFLYVALLMAYVPLRRILNGETDTAAEASAETV